MLAPKCEATQHKTNCLELFKARSMVIGSLLFSKVVGQLCDESLATKVPRCRKKIMDAEGKSWIMTKRIQALDS
eukprot:1162009-Pelagomonas_calceolata.AAC.1